MVLFLAKEIGEYGIVIEEILDNRLLGMDVTIITPESWPPDWPLL